MIRLALPLSFSLIFSFAATDVAAQRRLDLLGHDVTKAISDVEFSPDGSMLGSCSGDGTARVWSAHSGKLIASLQHEGPVEQIVFSPDGALVATSFVAESDDRRRTASVMIWNVPSWQGKRLANLTHGRPREVHALAFFPDSQRILTATRSYERKLTTELTVSDVQTASRLMTLTDTDNMFDIGFSPDGKFLAAVGSYGTRLGKGAVLLWETDTLDKPKQLRNDGGNYDLQFSPNSRLLAVTTKDLARRDTNRSPCSVNLWDLNAAKRAGDLSGFIGSISSMSFSPDSRLLAATATLPGEWGQQSGEAIQIWNLTTGEKRYLERDTHSQSLQFSPVDGTLATAFSTPRPGVRLWDIQSGSLRTTIGHGVARDVVVAVRYSPQGDKLAVANLSRSGKDLLSIFLWSDAAATGEPNP